MLRFSQQLNRGEVAPDFSLPDTEGKIVTLSSFNDSPALLVAFICNHCPFVEHILDSFVAMAAEYRGQGLATVAISSNDIAEFPEDSPELMRQLAQKKDFGFPYLYDESQDVAIAYNAICTPDFFIFDKERRLVYAGQFDASRPVINRKPVPGTPPLRTDLPVTGDDMRQAIEAVLGGREVPMPQRPSAGCSIKWKAEKEPSWA